MLTLFPFPPYHEFRDGRFHTDEGSHLATIDMTTYHTVQVCAGISQHFPFVTHSDDYSTFAVIHHLNGSEVAAFISVKAAITKFVIWGEWK